MYLLITFGTFILSLFLSLTEFVQKIEYSIRDQFFEIRGPLSVENSPVVLVAISEQADSEIPQKWPWPTSIHARLVENLNKAEAKAIVFDVLFTQGDEFNPVNDTLFANTLKEYGNVVLAGDVERSNTGNADQSIPIFPLNILRDRNPNNFGFVKTIPDLDGFVRSYTFGTKYLENDYYMLGIEALRLYSELEYSEIDRLGVNLDDNYFTLGDYSILREGDNRFIINYYGPENMFPVISYEEVIDDPDYTTVMEAEAFEINSFADPDFEMGLLYDEVFKDKIVIIGSTMPVLQDFHATPFTTADLPRPGFEIHAHAIQTILDGNYIREQGGFFRLVLMIVLAFVIVFFNRTFGASWGFAAMVISMGLYYFIALQFFLQLQVFVSVSSQIMIIFFGQVGTVGYEYVNEEREKRRIKGMFSSYVSPTLVDQMIESGEEPKLGGDDTYMTAFFSDIVSFSTFSERLEPKQLVTLINEYLTAMTDIINDQGGTLDKFIGDAIVAFFGAPVFIEDHALRACISSQLMEKKLEELRVKWKKDNWPEIVWRMQHRMGMNTGVMVTGNMGSERRFNYTMMGDNVNLAARCESGAKAYNVFTMVTESTKNDAEAKGDDCLFRKLDTIVVKGRYQPVTMYEIAGLRSDASQDLFECIGLYEQGMEAYFNQQWDSAKSFFQQSLALERYQKNPSRIFIERCEWMEANPPGRDWDGVFVMKTK